MQLCHEKVPSPRFFTLETYFLGINDPRGHFFLGGGGGGGHLSLGTIILFQVHRERGRGGVMGVICF